MSESPVPPDESPEQAGHSRRLFLAGTGAGLAATAVGAVALPAAAAESGDAAEAQVALGTVKPGAPVVAYVSDSAKDRVSIQRGGSEVVVRDAALVKALNRHLTRRHSAPRKES
ncbi:MAG TPA: hypothetical protein VE781_00365 [Kineosporiaceae bacterium]|jgi:hypothetical protein|nr:hypothetical protein [Kineosporiaceae bacterium]